MEAFKEDFKKFKHAAEELDAVMMAAEIEDDFLDQCNYELQSSNECISDIVDGASNSILVYSLTTVADNTHSAEEVHAICTSKSEADQAEAEVKKAYPHRELHQRTVESNKVYLNGGLL